MIKRIIILFFFIFLHLWYFVLSYFHLIPKRSYSNADFGIFDYVSEVDFDQDGEDNQTDILMGARAYVKSKPKYQSKYYASGFPNDEYGVCKDVVSYAFLASFII